MISRISGLSVVDAYMGVTTSTFNTSLRDATLFGKLILDRGKIDGKQLLASKWIDQILNITATDKERYLRNDVYPKAQMPWVAHKNFWWILDENKGEFAAI